MKCRGLSSLGPRNEKQVGRTPCTAGGARGQRDASRMESVRGSAIILQPRAGKPQRIS